MELDSPIEKGLGPQDVGAAGERSVREPDVVPRDDLVNLAGDVLFVGRRKRGVRVVADPVTAEMNDGRPRDDAQYLGIDSRGLADHPQLPARGRERTEVAADHAGRPFERRLRPLDVGREQVGLGLGRAARKYESSPDSATARSASAAKLAAFSRSPARKLKVAAFTAG